MGHKRLLAFFLCILLFVTLFPFSIFSESADSITFYTVVLKPGNGEGSNVSYSSSDQATIPVGRSNAKNCEFYYDDTKDNKMAFRLDDGWYPSAWSAPAGKVFSGWTACEGDFDDSILTVAETVLEADWEVDPKLPDPKVTFTPTSIDLNSSGYTDVDFSLSELVLPAKAKNSYGDTEYVNSVFFRFYPGELKDSAGNTVPFLMDREFHFGPKDERVSNPVNLSSLEQTFTMAFYIDPDTYADAPLGTYTGKCEYDVVWHGEIDEFIVIEEEEPRFLSLALTVRDTFGIKVTSGKNGKASASLGSAKKGTEVTLTAEPDNGYRFKEWKVVKGGVTVENNKFTVGTADVEIEAVFEEIPSHDLTILYKYENGETAASSVTKSYKEGDSYEISSPVIEGYTPDKAKVFGTMGDSDVEVTVNYKEYDHKVELTIEGSGSASADPVYGKKGTKVTLTADPDEGYILKSIEVLSGGVTLEGNSFTLGTLDVKIKVTFAKPTLTINYTYEDGSAAADSYKEECDAGGTYSVESPVIDGFTTVLTKVEGTMPDEDLTVSVIYYETAGYSVVSGGDSSLTEGKLSPVIITVKRDENDEICFDRFDSVSIDGAKLTEGTDFTAEAGSTVITLNKTLLGTLSTGTHTVTVGFVDGSAETTLRILAAELPVPDTGIAGNTDLWAALLAVSSSGLLSAVRKRRRNK